MRQFVVALLAAVVGGIAGAFLATGRGAPPADPSEAYLAANRAEVERMVLEDVEKYGVDIYRLYLEISQALPGLPGSDFAVDKAVKWLKSPACTNALYTIPPQKSYLRINGVIPNTPRQRAIAWRRLALSVLAPTETSVSTNHLGFHGVISFVFERQTIFDEQLSSTLADALNIRLGGWSELEFGGAPDDPALAFIAATVVKTPPQSELKPFVENLARTWNDGSPAVWLSNPEAGWWLARAINGATGGNLSLPPDADGNVRNVNWRGILAGKWINSQRIDHLGNGHWDNDAEKTAFAVLLLNEM